MTRDEVKVRVPRALLEAIVDDEPCWFDHHGNCQAHGYSLEPGEVCPQQQLKDLLAPLAQSDEPCPCGEPAAHCRSCGTPIEAEHHLCDDCYRRDVGDSF